MLTFPSNQRVFLACGTTDLCKSIDGLAAIVQESFGLNLFTSGLFVFCNRTCDKLKLLIIRCGLSNSAFKHCRRVLLDKR
ncbi:hypothetical protein B1748_05110 [Paenibacillus sp. MY03]|uniref:IS66 family insertion sequence element accessory protein TnpB n=1 Tax=Paenibacillus sp. MY03 TaxID=302980 RepID=UPI000B3C3E8E|nr:hypothetical protein B1748_05110 [Paenibacillus sp. MY03]